MHLKKKKNNNYFNKPFYLLFTITTNTHMRAFFVCWKQQYQTQNKYLKKKIIINYLLLWIIHSTHIRACFDLFQIKYDNVA